MSESTLSPRPLTQQGPGPGELPEIRRRLHQEVERCVRRLRLGGASWEQVAAYCGTPKTTVWRNFRHVDQMPIAVCARGPVGERQAWFECAVTGVTFRDSDDLVLTPAQRQMLTSAFAGQTYVVEQ